MTELPHHCSACGEVHGGSAAETEAVRIAKINADRDIEVARLARAEARQDIETRLEETEVIAGAQVEEAVVTAGVLEQLVTPEPAPEPEPEPEPAPVIIPAPGGDDEGVPAPPETDRKPPEKAGGFWSGYDLS